MVSVLIQRRESLERLRAHRDQPRATGRYSGHLLPADTAKRFGRVGHALPVHPIRRSPHRGVAIQVRLVERIAPEAFA